jgi:hypothetical protein
MFRPFSLEKTKQNLQFFLRGEFTYFRRICGQKRVFKAARRIFAANTSDAAACKMIAAEVSSTFSEYQMNDQTTILYSHKHMSKFLFSSKILKMNFDCCSTTAFLRKILCTSFLPKKKLTEEYSTGTGVMPSGCKLLP